MERNLQIMLFVSVLIGLLGVNRLTLAHQSNGCAEGQLMVNGECGTGDIESLQVGWNSIMPEGETICAHGTPYTYWVHPGTSDNLMLYFEGGGGCWNADTCRQGSTGYYDSDVTQRDSPQFANGVLDMDNPANPFANYTTVFIPVCTGDVHWGNQVTTFEDAEEGDVTIHFNGFANASSALSWAYENVTAPESVFMTGCSAGSPGSLLHAPYVIEQYPDTPIYQFGDSLSLLFTGPVDLQVSWGAHDNFPAWIPELAEMQPEEWTMAGHYIATANHYPEHRFGQYNSIRDSVQVFYTFPSGQGSSDDWTPLLDAHLEEVSTNTENYFSFTSGGDLHCVTPRASFYTYAIDGISLVDWLTDFTNDETVDSLHCTECESAETRLVAD